ARPARPRHPSAAAAAVRRRRLHAAVQPDRHVRARRPPRRHGPDRPEDHRRHLRRHGPPRRRRLLRQGPDEGRPVGRLRHPPGRQGRGGRRPGPPLRGPGGLRHRQGPARLGARRDVRHGRGRPREAARPHPGRLRPAAGGHHRPARPAPPDLPQDGGLRALRPARQGVHLGAGRRDRRRPPLRLRGLTLPYAADVLTTTATRVCRVAVDVLAVERLFDYTVPEPLAPTVGVGTIVRVNLGGRRVRAWVVDDDVVPEAAPEKLRPLVAAVSAGPSAEVVALTAWAARRFAGPRLPLLRAASPAADHPRRAPESRRSAQRGPAARMRVIRPPPRPARPLRVTRPATCPARPLLLVGPATWPARPLPVIWPRMPGGGRWRWSGGRRRPTPATCWPAWWPATARRSSSFRTGGSGRWRPGCGRPGRRSSPG